MSQLEYCCLIDVKDDLNIRETDFRHDRRLQRMIYRASAAVKNYMGDKSVYQATRYSDDEPLLDSNFEPIVDSVSGEPTVSDVRDEVQWATILLVKHYFEGRDMNTESGTMLPPEVTSLLYPLRDPQLK